MFCDDRCHDFCSLKLEYLHSKIKFMEYIFSQSGPAGLYQRMEKKRSSLSSFFSWAAGQELENHVAWVGISIMLMAAVISPIAISIVLLNGASFNLIMATMAALALVVTSNLAAMSTKYTIPILLLATLMDLGIVIASFIIR